jgi:tetratricopeptide (TPR) repeat protein
LSAIIALLAVVTLGWWFIADLKSMPASRIEQHRLNAAGDWEGLRRHVVRERATKRLFVRLIDLRTPGARIASGALVLHQLGDDECALAWMNEALRASRRNAKIQALVQRGRMLILTSLGRYEEVRAAALQVAERAGPESSDFVPYGLSELYRGDAAKAISILEPIVAHDARNDEARIFLSMSYGFRGDSDRALRALDYEPASIERHHGAGQIRNHEATIEGQKYLQSERATYDAVHQPLPLIQRADTHIDRGDGANALAALEAGALRLGKNLVVQARFHEVKARALATLRREAEAEAELEAMWQIVRSHPRLNRRSSAPLAAAKTHIELCRFDQAALELDAAEERAVHPIERHAITYWRARSAELTGNLVLARTLYGRVLEDGITSKYATGARSFLAQGADAPT